MQEVFQCATEKRVFCKVDIKDAFHHLTIVEEHKHLTAFSTPWGDFEYNALPQGWCNSPAHWQRFIAHILHDFWRTFCFAYSDDIIIFSNSMTQSFLHSRLVLSRLQKANLTINDKKSVWHKPTITFLGVNLRFGATSPIIPTHTIATWPVPQTKKKLQQWLGFANSFRNHVPNLSQLSLQLTECLRHQKWRWTAHHTTSFQGMQHALIRAITLTTHKPGINAELILDASDSGLGVILKEGKYVVAVISRRLTPAEANYDTKERELLAVVWGTKTLMHYVADAPTLIIHSDHENLVRNLQPGPTEKRLFRWIDWLSNFHLSWHHIKGVDNPADGPSRLWE